MEYHHVFELGSSNLFTFWFESEAPLEEFTQRVSRMLRLKYGDRGEPVRQEGRRFFVGETLVAEIRDGSLLRTIPS